MGEYFTGLILGGLMCFSFTYGMKEYRITSENIQAAEKVCIENEGVKNLVVHSKDFSDNIIVVCGNGGKFSLK